MQHYMQEVAAATNLDLPALWQNYISYQNIPSFLFFNDPYTITDAVLDLLKRVVVEDIPKLKPTFTAFTPAERLLLRLAGSDEVNPEKIASLIGLKQHDVDDLLDLLAQAELLQVLAPFGGLDTRISKNKKAFFLSPSLRRALLTSWYGQNLPDSFGSKLIEDTVVMYLKKELTASMLSFVTGSTTANPDFVVETRDQPILLEVGTGKTSTRQITNAKVSYRYGLLVSNGVTAPAWRGDVLQIPLRWFLLL